MKLYSPLSTELILETLTFNAPSEWKETEPMVIAYGIDENFVMGCGVSITSILTENRDQTLEFHIFINKIDDEQVAMFGALAVEMDTCIRIHLICEDRFSAFPTTKNWSIATYFRFIAVEYFIGKAARIFYIDADIICNGSISHLQTMDLCGHVVAAVPDPDRKLWSDRANALNCAALSQGYFNAGFLLIDIRQWEQKNLSQSALSMLSDEKIAVKLAYLDQDVLNVVLAGNVIFLEGKYNTHLNLNYELTSPQSLPDDALMIHYVGPSKPWHSWSGQYPGASLFRAKKILSLWNMTPLLAPESTNHTRYCAKHCLRQKKCIAGLGYYLCYFYRKAVMAFKSVGEK